MKKLAKNFKPRKKTVNTMMEACDCYCRACTLITCDCKGGPIELQAAYAQTGYGSNQMNLVNSTFASVTSSM